MSSYAVVIPSKTASNLLPCLTALRKHEPDCPVVVVDDGLDIQGRDQLAFCEPIHVVPGIKPFVFARNVNIGIQYGRWALWKPDGYVLQNDDTLLQSPGGFRLMAECCAADPSIGVIGATTNLTGQPLQNRRDVGLRFVPHIAFVCVYIPRRTINLLGTGPFRPSEWFTGGLLDERYVGYGCEDADYCEQVTRAGLKVAVHDGCYVDHGSLKSSFRGPATAGGDFSANYKLLMAKWGGRLMTQPNVQAPPVRDVNYETMRKLGLCD